MFETWNYVINIWLRYAKSKQEFENIIGQNIDYLIIDQYQIKCEGTFRKEKTELKGYVIKDASYSYVIVMSLKWKSKIPATD